MQVEKKTLLICLVLVLLNVITIIDARILLFDFMIGRRNRKSARKIHKEQSFKDRITMGYIYPMLKKNTVEFKWYHTLYLNVLYTIVPQCAVVVLVGMFFPKIVLYVGGVFFALGIVAAIIYRVALPGGRGGRSQYSKK